MHTLIIGAPGTGKTILAQTLKKQGILCDTDALIIPDFRSKDGVPIDYSTICATTEFAVSDPRFDVVIILRKPMLCPSQSST